MTAPAYLPGGEGTVPRSRLQAFCRELGFAPDQVRSIVLGAHEVTVTSYHLREDGKGRHVVPGTNGVVTVTTDLKVISDIDDGEETP